MRRARSPASRRGTRPLDPARGHLPPPRRVSISAFSVRMPLMRAREVHSPAVCSHFQQDGCPKPRRPRPAPVDSGTGACVLKAGVRAALRSPASHTLSTLGELQGCYQNSMLRRARLFNPPSHGKDINVGRWHGRADPPVRVTQRPRTLRANRRIDQRPNPADESKPDARPRSGAGREERRARLPDRSKTPEPFE
jgi:hypothetical protein